MILVKCALVVQIGLNSFISKNFEGELLKHNTGTWLVDFTKELRQYDKEYVTPYAKEIDSNRCFVIKGVLNGSR